MLLSDSAPVSGSLGDPIGSSALVAAVSWLEGTLLGTVATTLAVIGIASVGFMMFAGRVDVRRGLTVVLGCFLLFGASAIASGILASVRSEQWAEPPAIAEPPAPTITIDP